MLTGPPSIRINQCLPISSHDMSAYTQTDSIRKSVTSGFDSG